MQGQRSIVGSLAESVDFDHGPPPPSNTGGGQQIFWNDIRTSEENGFADFLHLNEPVSQEPQIVSGWNLAESSSSLLRNDLLQNAPKTDNPWSSAPSQHMARVDESDGLTLSRQYNPDVSPHTLNLNSGYMDHAADRTTNENEERGGCSIDGCRQSCKRKAIECGIGQSSSSSMFPSESSQWSHISQNYDSNNLSISQTPSPRLGLGLRGAAESSHGEGSHRSFRLRINPSSHDANPRHCVSPLAHQPPHRLLPIEHYEFGTSGTPMNTQPQSQPQPQPPILMHPNMHSRTSLAPLAYGERNLLDNAIPLPSSEVRASPRNLIGRSVAGSSRTIGSSSRGGLNSNPSPPWIPPNGSSRSSRRLAEYVRRSLLSSSIAEQSELRNNPLHMGPSPDEPGRHLHRRSVPRSSWVDRQGDGLLGIPYPLRTFTQGNEGRSRHVSEQIRNMLDIMRRGEGLRLEDVMILDQSVFFGVSDVHDRHRDMRLDVDNMSYEELLALEERIGNVSTGLSEETILKLLKLHKYSHGQDEPCCVCQEDYGDGDNVGSLDCGHLFHKDCIKQWLMHKNWCPICKTTGLAT